MVFPYDDAMLDHPVAESTMQRRVAVPADEHNAGAGEIQSEEQDHPEQGAEGWVRSAAGNGSRIKAKRHSRLLVKHGSHFVGIHAVPAR